MKTKNARRRPPRRGHVVDRRKYDDDVAERVFGGIRATMRTRDSADDGPINISARKLKE